MWVWLTSSWSSRTSHQSIRTIHMRFTCLVLPNCQKRVDWNIWSCLFSIPRCSSDPFLKTLQGTTDLWNCFLISFYIIRSPFLTTCFICIIFSLFSLVTMFKAIYSIYFDSTFMFLEVWVVSCDVWYSFKAVAIF